MMDLTLRERQGLEEVFDVLYEKDETLLTKIRQFFKKFL